MSHKLDASGLTYLWGKIRGELPTLSADGTHYTAGMFAESKTQAQMSAIVTPASDKLYLVEQAVSTS